MKMDVEETPSGRVHHPPDLTLGTVLGGKTS